MTLRSPIAMNFWDAIPVARSAPATTAPVFEFHCVAIIIEATQNTIAGSIDVPKFAVDQVN